MAGLDMDDFEDFMAKVNEVDAAVKGLASGEIKPDEIDDREIRMAEREEAAKAKRMAAKEAARKTVEEKRAAEAKKQEYIDEHREELMEKVRALQEDREKKEHARKRFAKWRSKHSKTMNCDYKGWDMWEPDEDPDDDIYKDCPPPDTPELRAMEKDIEERGRKKRAREKLADQERQHGNAAFKAGQWSAALRCYDTAVENDKCNRVLLTNRASAQDLLVLWPVW
eukprot:SAG31_NODE_13179_length_887_cov_1.629442_1_plen_224_part_01